VAEVSEDALGLYYWDGAAWVDAACGPYDRHTDANWRRGWMRPAAPTTATPTPTGSPSRSVT